MAKRYDNAWYGRKNVSDEFFQALSNHKYKCKCGHTVIITYKQDYKICRWCGKKVFKDKKTEFKDKLRKSMY